MKLSSLTTLLALLCCMAALTYSCHSDEEFTPADNGFVEDVESHLSFTENPDAGIPDRVQIFNQALVLGDTSLGRSNPGEDAIWVHAADLATITFEGDVFSATQIVFADKRAYVSYHVRGPIYRGLVEVVDLGDPKKPKVIGQVLFLGADVNALTVEQSPQNSNKRKIWLALSDEKKGGILAELEVKNNGFNHNYYRQAVLSNFMEDEQPTGSANGIVEAGDLLHISSGRTYGGAYSFQKSSMEFVGVRAFSNAKAVAKNGDQAGSSYVAALSAGDDATVYVDRVGNAGFDSAYPLGSGLFHKNVEEPLSGKFTLAFAAPGSSVLHVAAGEKGILSLDAATGGLLYKSPEGMLPLGNCNAVHTDDEFLYLANGADGITICALTPEGLPDESHVFLWDMAEVGASANFIQTDGDWVFIAKGGGGVKILKKPTPGDLLPICGFDAQGAPACKNLETLCPTLLAEVNAKIPIGGKQPLLHPTWFTSGVHEMLIEEDATLDVTFVDENTNKKQALGYYFYSADNPPSSSSELLGLVIFPNFSKVGSGGSLEAGTTVHLPTEFKAGTKVGFFLVKDGWTGTNLNFGQGMTFTNPAFNPNPNKQGLLLYDADCDLWLGAFEHNPLQSNNADFRELVFSIRVTPSSAVDFHDFSQL